VYVPLQYAIEHQEIEVSKAVYSIDGSAGGDRVEKFVGSDHRVHLVVLDACGHGAGAGEVADAALHTIRALLWQGLTPAAVFASFNELLLDLYERQKENAVGSGAILTLDRTRSTATFASAGHVDVLRFAEDGRSHKHHRSTGPVFGAMRNASYEDECLGYVPGEFILFLTDGLLNIRRVDGTRERSWGTADICHTFRRVLTSPEGATAARLISRVRQIAGGAFDDDVAAMIVQVR
jgi:serine phosphatase RsbU (regulator of sigma subunit)